MTRQNRKKTTRAKSNGHGRFSLARNLNELGSSAQGAVRSGRQAVSSAYRMASGLSHSLPSARDMVPRVPSNLQKMVDDNPLIIGVIGIGVGLLLGALMPIGGGASSSAQRSSAAGKGRRSSRSAGAKRGRSAARRAKASSATRQSGKAPAQATATGS